MPWWKRKKAPETPAVKQDEAPQPYRQDDWQNVYTGLGTDRDKVTQGMYWAPVRIMDQELMAMYNGSDLAARIVETKPKEMMRRGYEIDIDGDEEADEDELAQLMKYGEKLRCNELVTETGVWANLFGGGVLIVGAEDGLTPDKPLNEKSIRTVRYLNSIDRRFVFVQSYYNNPLEPNYGLPETYLITRAVGGPAAAPGSVVVHETRVIRFDGAKSDILTRQQLAGWSWSLLQRAYGPLRYFESGFQSVANLMSDASQAVFKIQGLISMLTSNEKDNLATRTQLVDMSRSVARAVLLDAENEEFSRESTSFAGLADLLDRFMMRLSAAVQIPVSLLMGRSAAGMDSTGEMDVRAFYDSIALDQKNELEPKLKRLYHLFAIAKDSPLSGQDLEFKVKWAPLWQPSDKEQAEIEKTVAERDQIYTTIGACTPEDVAMSRWGKGGFNGAGLAAFKPEQAERDAQDKRMFGNMLEPPPELQGRNAAGQGQQPGLQAQLPGGEAGANAPQPPIGAAASPYGVTKDPRQIVKSLHEPPEPVK